MCYHASIVATYQQLSDAYDRPFEGEFPSFNDLNQAVAPRVSGFDFPLLPIITAEKPNSIQCYRWGLIPPWAKDFNEAKEIRMHTLNARSETMYEKPAFKNAVQSQRCLVPLSGFFEWQHPNSKTKIPYFISLAQQEIFSVAGIYESWLNPVDNNIINSFSLLTTEANEVMATIHNTKKRMPVILLKSQEENWIKPNLKNEEAMKLCTPIASSLMKFQVLSTPTPQLKLL